MSDADLPNSRLSRLRLLVALDALLVTGSVSGAAEVLAISTPAASRLLAQLRQMFDDPLLIRAGRQMMPTPLAESLRKRVRAIAAEASSILLEPQKTAEMIDAQSVESVGSSVQQQVELALGRYANPPLAIRETTPLEGQPSEAQIRARLASIGPNHASSERLGRYIATIGSGQGRTRPLTLEEASDAFAILLDGEAEAVQIGAFLTLLQYRGITPVELAGLVKAARRTLASEGEWAVDLDWPAYSSPFNRNPPWFLLAAKLVAGAGHRVILHGLGPALSPYTAVLEALKIPAAASLSVAGRLIEVTGCAYLPLTAIHPQIQALINLYPKLQMRSPMQLGLQLLNPLGASVTMMGLPRATLGALHREAFGLLDGQRLMCIDSHRDVAQATPHRVMTLALTQGEQTESLTVPPSQTVRPSSPPPSYSSAEYCAAVWTGQLRSAEANATVIETVALALLALGKAEFDFAQARQQAETLWNERDRSL